MAKNIILTGIAGERITAVLEDNVVTALQVSYRLSDDEGLTYPSDTSPVTVPVNADDLALLTTLYQTKAMLFIKQQEGI